jgi:RNA polymerase sigma-70 factor (ECF subfamily)
MLSAKKGNLLKESSLSLEKLDITSQEIFSQLFQQTHVQIYRYLSGLTGGLPEEIDDLVAESFARAWSARHNFQGDFKAALRWLLIIAKHQMIDSYRRRKVSGVPESLDINDPPAPGAGPESQALCGERRQILWALLQSLPEEAREMLVLRYILDWSVGEIATHMHKNETAVSMAIHRALKRLQQDWLIKDAVVDTRSELNV